VERQLPLICSLGVTACVHSWVVAIRLQEEVAAVISKLL
jgi:hypothetical protein